MTPSANSTAATLVPSASGNLTASAVPTLQPTDSGQGGGAGGGAGGGGGGQKHVNPGMGVGVGIALGFTGVVVAMMAWQLLTNYRDRRRRRRPATSEVGFAMAGPAKPRTGASSQSGSADREQDLGETPMSGALPSPLPPSPMSGGDPPSSPRERGPPRGQQKPAADSESRRLRTTEREVAG